MKRTSGPACLLAAAHLTAGAFLLHAATVTVNHGGAPVYATALYGAAGLAAVTALATATGTRRPPARTRPGTSAEDRAAAWTCGCDRWWTSFGTQHDTWCPNYRTRSTT